MNNFYLNKNYSKYKYINQIKKNSTYLQIFFLNFNLTNEIIKNTLKLSFFQFFFNLFLQNKYREMFLKKLKKKISPERKAKIYEILAQKPYCFFIYRLFSFYFNFLIDWKLNFSSLIKNNAKFNSHFSNFFSRMLEPLSELWKKWKYNLFVNFRELHFFFYEALENISLNLKNFFYHNFLLKKEINLNLKFLVSNLFIYINKLNSKETNENFFLLDDFVKLSDFFLGKWFYYKQKTHFCNNFFDAHYNIFNPSKIFNLSQKEIYIHNLLRTNFSEILIFKKLDIYLRKAATNSEIIKKNKIEKINKIIQKNMNFFKKLKKFNSKKNKVYTINKKAHIYNYMKKLKLLVIEEMFINIYNYRKFRWSKKFGEFINNPLEVGLNFRMPAISKGKHFLKRKKFIKDLKFTFFSKIRRRFFRRKFYKFYKNDFDESQEIILTNTFLCIYKTLKFEKINFYQKNLFWFNK
jgi:hypothetical protein